MLLQQTETFAPHHMLLQLFPSSDQQIVLPHLTITSPIIPNKKHIRSTAFFWTLTGKLNTTAQISLS